VTIGHTKNIKFLPPAGPICRLLKEIPKNADSKIAKICNQYVILWHEIHIACCANLLTEDTKVLKCSDGYHAFMKISYRTLKNTEY